MCPLPSFLDRPRTRRQFLKETAFAALAALAPRWARAQKTTETGASAALPTSVAVLALNRAAFGPRPGDVEAFAGLGTTETKRLAAWVERQLHPESILDPECERRLSMLKFTALAKPVAQLWKDYHLAANTMRDRMKGMAPGAVDPGKNKNPDEQALRHVPVRETEAATWASAVYSERQLFEVLVYFWHDHFNVFGWEQPICSVFSHYDREVIRRHALGNFRVFLEAVAQSPAMLFYLDGFINQSGNPNENFARELFELHTLGAENYLGTRERRKVPGYGQGKPVGYVDGDVYETARCLTGWRVDTGAKSNETGEFVYFEPWHDRFQKIVLGRQLPEYQSPLKDGRDVLDRLCAHPGTARHIAWRLCRRLVADDPPKPLIERAAEVFLKNRKHPHQLRAVMRTILLSAEFRSSWGRKIKRPFESAVGSLRATAAEFWPSEPFLNNFARSGERLFQYRTPDGYPDIREKWASTTPMLERWRLANIIAAGNMEGITQNFAAKTPAWAKTPAAVAGFWARRMLGRPMSLKNLDCIGKFLANGKAVDSEPPRAALLARLPGAIALILMSPELQWR